MERRRFLELCAAALSACGGSATGSPATSPSSAAASSGTPPPRPAPIALEKRTVESVEWTFPNEYGGPKRAVVLFPKPIPPGTRLPILVALHGLGETIDPVTGANGWRKAYELDRTYARLLEPPLEPDAFQGLVTSERLTEINESLAERPFGGVIVACPYLPKEIGGAMPIELYAQWLGDRLLPRVRDELPGALDARATGIDGVSLGGWTALRIGLTRPDLFGAIGALQPAIGDYAMVEWAQALITQHLKGRPLRIVTSTEDLYRPTLVALDQKLTQKGIAHEFAITPGPHDYPWNKGPGGIEMLLFHDRVLRG